MTLGSWSRREGGGLLGGREAEGRQEAEAGCSGPAFLRTELQAGKFVSSGSLLISFLAGKTKLQ